jgi:sugar/nucleoside kinase (ribokinase family)
MFAVIGTTTADLFISGVARMPRFDGDEFTANNQVVCGQPLTMTLGGNGANSAYILGALGAPVMLCSVTGTDSIGSMVAGWLAARGVDLRGLRQREGGSATNTTVIDDGLNRMSFYYPGLFSAFNEADLNDAVWAEAHTLLVTGYPLLPGFRRGGFAYALEKARASGLVTALDIGPATAQPATWDEIVPLLPLVDYLLLNEYELALVTGIEHVEAGVRQLQHAGAACIITKRGQAGAFILTKDTAIQAAGFPVEARVTIGAGDTFNAGFLYARHAGMSLAEAAAFANAAAALVVQTGRSVLGAPDAAQVGAFLNQGTGA